jgi:hypothetical protein
MKLFLVILVFTLTISSTIKASSLEEYMIQPNEVVDGNTINDYVNIWWQWAYSMPNESSPVRDVTGERCHVGQHGKVWFLAGGYGTSKIRRRCTIPEGKYIFFPVINMVYWPKQKGSLSCEDAKKYAALNNDELLSIEINLNEAHASNPAHTRLSSEKCFNLLGLVPLEYNPPNVYPAASDGYWVMLKPLEKGLHTLKFNAIYDREKGPYSKMAQDIEYEIIVE